MTAVATRASVFSFLPDDHPFAAQLGDLRARLEGSDLPAGARSEVSSELKGVRTAQGFALARFYCSVQAWDAAGGQPFEATTLHWSVGSGPRWARFPDEPRLPHVATYLGDRASGQDGPRYEVLRYVPLRRLTFRSGPVVGKFKRASRLGDSAGRVAAVVAAAAGSPVTVPALRGVDVTHGVYLQDAAPGVALNDVVGRTLHDDHPGGATGVTDALATVGRIHADFHALDAPGLPVQADPDVHLCDVRDSADWAAQLLPDLGGWLRTTRDRLLATAPAASVAAMGTCHGDLVLSHLLADDDGCTVIDLDLAHVGDRYRDLALFLSGLVGDAPALDPRTSSEAVLAGAEAAYLDAYEERSGHRLDRRRLAWHRAAAELHQLAVVLSKDRFDPDDVPRVTALVDDCVALS